MGTDGKITSITSIKNKNCKIFLKPTKNFLSKHKKYLSYDFEL
jgi:hypothetical protein